MGTIPPYSGDNTIRKILKKHRASLGLEELKAAIMGSILAPGMVPPSGILPLVFGEGDDEASPFQSEQDFMNDAQAILGLWNELSAHQDPVDPFEFTPFPSDLSSKGPEVISTCAQLRLREMEFFIEFLEAGGLLPGDESDEPPQDLPGFLRAGIRFIRDEIAGEGKGPAFNVDALLTLDKNTRKEMPRFAAAMKKERAAAFRRSPSIPHAGAPPHSPFITEEDKPGRNAPCPCGSGKKYKKWCGK